VTPTTRAAVLGALDGKSDPESMAEAICREAGLDPDLREPFAAAFASVLQAKDEEMEKATEKAADKAYDEGQREASDDLRGAEEQIRDLQRALLHVASQRHGYSPAEDCGPCRKVRRLLAEARR
jgi:hypothetical protein